MVRYSLLFQSKKNPEYSDGSYMNDKNEKEWKMISRFDPALSESLTFHK